MNYSIVIDDFIQRLIKFYLIAVCIVIYKNDISHNFNRSTWYNIYFQLG
jgi:hypothetical protein